MSVQLGDVVLRGGRRGQARQTWTVFFDVEHLHVLALVLCKAQGNRIYTVNSTRQRGLYCMEE